MGNKKIVVLYDGKKGHLNQSLAICELLEYDYKIFDLSEYYKNFFERIKIKYLGIIPKNLKNFLENDKFDYVISAGTFLNRLNVSVKKKYGIKNIICMKPNLASKKDFDVIIVPFHDNLKGVNVVKTPVVISRFFVENKNDKIDKKRFGIVLGGNSKEFNLEMENINFIFEYLNSENISYIVTNSRRTPEKINEFIYKNIKNNEFIDVNVSKKTLDYVFKNCDKIIVTQDSMSMISEAVLSLKDVFVVKLNAKNKYKKFHVFLNELVKEKYVYVINKDNIKKVLNLKTKKIDIDDVKRRIIEKIEGL